MMYLLSVSKISARNYNPKHFGQNDKLTLTFYKLCSPAVFNLTTSVRNLPNHYRCNERKLISNYEIYFRTLQNVKKIPRLMGQITSSNAFQFHVLSK